MEKQQQHRRGLLAPFHYLVLGIIGTIVGFGLLNAAPGARSGGPVWIVLVIVGIVFTLTGLIRGATKGWTNRDLG